MARRSFEQVVAGVGQAQREFAAEAVSNGNREPAAPQAGSTADVLRRAGEADGGQMVVRLPLSDIGPHPLNPRDDLVLDEGFLASIRTNGVRVPITVRRREDVCRDHPELAARIGTPYVVTMGHRRREGSLVVGKDTIPAIIDLSGGGGAADQHLDDFKTFWIENAERLGFNPIEEARLFAAYMASEGLNQKQVATALGVSEGHVSKRLALLDLPARIQELIGSGEAPAAVGTQLQKVAPEDRLDVWDAARERNVPLSTVVAEYETSRARFAADRAALAALAEEGVEVVDAAKWWGSQRGDHRLTELEEIATARAAGLLVADVSDGEIRYYTREVPRHRPTRRPRGAVSNGNPGADVDARATKAAERRTAAARRLACSVVLADEMLDLAARHALTGRPFSAEAVTLAWTWARAFAGKPGLDAGEWRAGIARGVGHKPVGEEVHRLVWALLIADLEMQTRSAQRWGALQRRYLALLETHADYEPTSWELEQREQAKSAGEG